MGKGGRSARSSSVNTEVPWRCFDDCLLLALRLTPKAASDSVDGVGAGPNGPVVKARVRAIPDRGKANAAIEKVVAKWLGLPKTSISVSSGSTSRNKTLKISGDPKSIAAKLKAAVAELD